MSLFIDNFDSAENVTGRRQISRGRRIGTVAVQTARRSAPVQGNPTKSFTAQADIVLTWVAKAGAVNTSKIPFSLFGNSDARALYTKFLTVQPLNNVNYVYAGFYIVPNISLTNILAGVALPVGSVSGDGFFLFTNPVTGDWMGVIVHCNQVAYGALLDATNSDRFVISAIRFALPNPATLTQYGEQITYLYQSLFGKAITDSLNPLSYKDPNQFQAGIIDIPLGSNGWGIDKSSQFGGYIIPSQVMTWSIFIQSETRLTA